ncbi:acyl carrier protein phosphodiesterase [Myroides sp. LJL119]
MNFLAHIYLSKEIDHLKIGNFIADSVVGKRYLDYPPQIQKGIILHRHIDTFTDSHPIWRSSKKHIVPVYGHYSGVIVDMYYDYFLALHWDKFCNVALQSYAQSFYNLLQNNFELLPKKVQNFLPIMIQENWLVKYKTIQGLSYILKQMDTRTKGISKMSQATNQLIEHHQELESQFFAFFKELQQEVDFFMSLNKF